MSSDEIAIRIRDVSKHYLMFDRPEDRLKQMIVPRLKRLAGLTPRAYFRDFAALNGVNLEIKRGETVGIIGRNGSGKSTLLQVICGTLQPTTGTVEVNGRIAALLELGSGFNPEFTGRENVYLNAAILGLPREEIDARFDAIARFADIGMFLDQPVKTYSSGMYVRLAFATAINVDPDILVVDEALSVGDEAFQRKCFARIEEIKDKGATILFVSHGAQTIVQLCDRAVLIDRGEKLLEGRPKMVVSQYQRLVNLSGEAASKARRDITQIAEGAFNGNDEERTRNSGTPIEERSLLNLNQGTFEPNLVSNSMMEYESHGARIIDIRIETTDGRRVNVLKLGQVYVVAYTVKFSEAARQIIFGFQAKTISGLTLAGANNQKMPATQLRTVAAGESYDVRFAFTCRYLPGTFLIDVGVMGTQEGENRFLHRIVDGLIFRVAPEKEIFDQGLFSLNTELRIIPSANSTNLKVSAQ